MTRIRSARPGDLHRVQRIEEAAGAAFRALGMDAVAEEEPPPIEHLAEYQRAGRAWVAEERGHVVGYLLVDVVAGGAHVEQVSVDPAHARRGIGRELIQIAEGWARGQGLSNMTLTTFKLVPWNAPYYAKLGFVVLPDGEQPPQLAALRRAEADRGLDAWPRVTMRRPLEQTPWTPGSAQRFLGGTSTGNR
ncbi:GNAT family N-acetyltransferase [Quadrisphaera sp. DSM 44207]|uniref:GNAT family N-acetyltransferase n=1 Tax=Quadrisphaera sp. DSM 44207 TaxID=1881057 RepID=UPI00088E1782|nr:GNAT family N-acetyltransferase [Quadrisphaera sp. DSM 44207]SDQ77349.1 Predicted N-acetyltransferase YhbS [Quadrisphaera sp. DSM 44207]